MPRRFAQIGFRYGGRARLNFTASTSADFVYAGMLIRQYIPKGSDISKYSDEYIKEVETKFNNRPRKSSGFQAPLEVMLENNQFKTLEDFGIITKQKTPIAGVRLEG